MNARTARQCWSITLLLSSIFFAHVNTCSGIMRNIWWTEISSRWTLSGVCAIEAHRIILRRSVLRQTQKHFRRILTGIHTTQLWGHSSPWASGLQWTASALKVDTQRPSVSVTHSSLIFGTHISHIPIFYWHLFCIVWVRPRRLTITFTGVNSFVLSVWQVECFLCLFSFALTSLSESWFLINTQIPWFVLLLFSLQFMRLIIDEQFNSFLRHSFLAELRNSSGRMAMLERELGGLCKEFSAVKVLKDVPLLLTQQVFPSVITVSPILFSGKCRPKA